MALFEGTVVKDTASGRVTMNSQTGTFNLKKGSGDASTTALHRSFVGYYCATAAGSKARWSDAVEKGVTDKETLAQKLKQATDACDAAYGGAGEAGALIENIGHTNLHYGNLITYMRMLGLVPPSS